MAAAATANAKRPHDAIGTVEHDYSRALQVLQMTLPLLRPTQAGAPLDASACLELLVEQWSKDAARHDATVTPYKARIASRPMYKPMERLRKRLSSVWNLLGNAEADERAELVELVKLLQDGAGRSKLIEMYGARVDADGGDVDVVDPEPTRPVSPPPAPTWAPKYDLGIRVVLFGLRADA